MIRLSEELRSDLHPESDAINRIWKKREAQFMPMVTGMLSRVGELQGFGQKAIGQLGRIAALPDAEAVEPTDASN